MNWKRSVLSFFYKVEVGTKNFFWFLVKLVFWVGLLGWLMPLLVNLFLESFGRDANLTVSDLMLFITAAFIIAYTYETQKQAKATEKIAEYHMIPAVDVNMVYDQQKNKTYFWFSNNSNIPALVSIEASFTLKKNSHFIGPYRIPPQTTDKPTAPDFFDRSAPNEDKYHVEGVVAVISVKVRPDIENISPDIGINFKKSYNFHGGKWDEKTWGGPDQESKLYN